jgi:hypothetical protein
MEEFNRIVADPTSTGAVLFAVARGKVRAVLCCALAACTYVHLAESMGLRRVARMQVSEGVDFSDASGRGVIVTGIPFPAYKDLRVWR